jgi:uncharacterized membrane protein (DUF373 family)
MFEQKLITGMKNFNQIIHVLLALVVACVMVIWDFGSLFILWTLSTLISAERSYLLTGRTSVRVFVEVAMISVIREMIVQPVQVISNGSETNFNPIRYGLLLAALQVCGIVYKLASDPNHGDVTTTAE